MAPKRPATFRLNENLLNALQRIKDRDGTSVSDQIERALEAWVDARGVLVAASGEGSMMRQIERLTGEGLVTRENGGEIGRRPYSLTVWQEVHVAQSLGPTPPTELPGLKSVEGTVRFNDDELFKLVGESLELTLQDGRRFKFFLRNSNGAIAARGGIE